MLFFFSFFIFSRCWEQWEQRDDWVTAVLLSNTLALWKERELSDMAPLAFGEPAWYECTKEYAFFFSRLLDGTASFPIAYVQDTKMCHSLHDPANQFPAHSDHA